MTDILLREVLPELLFGGTTPFYIITEILFMIGLSRMFLKSGVPGWWAFCPWAKHYWLGKCAGKEPEGRVTSVCSFLSFVFFINSILSRTGSLFENIYVNRMLTILNVMVGLVSIVYTAQVYNGLIDVYERRKIWMGPWFLSRMIPIPTLLWGFSPKFQPSWKVTDFRENAVSHVSGRDVAEMGEGLTVNLKERSVTEFFQKKVLLKDIHMNIKPGRLVMLLGGSGAGKTTYVNAINGYEKANAKVILNGRNVYKEYSKMLYEVGFVPQSDLMRGKDTVYFTLMDYAKMRLPSDFSGQDRRDRVEEALKIFGLGPVRNNLVEKLSGGQRKRLSIAMEFISNPSLFILDEPDSGVDGVMARELFKQLRTIADTGRIVIAITHTPDRVIDLFDDVIILAKDSDRTGRLAFFGPVEKCREFFGKERMEEVVKSINRPEEGGDGRADEFIMKYAEVQNG